MKQTFEFKPDISFVATNDKLVLIFDSMCVYDMTREVRAVQINKGFDKLYYKIRGFDDLKKSDAGEVTVQCEIALFVETGGVVEESSLANSKFSFPQIGKTKKLVYAFEKPEEVEAIVRQGMADTFYKKLSECLESQQTTETLRLGREANNVVHLPKSKDSGQTKAQTWYQRNKSVLMAVLVPSFLIFSAGAIMNKYSAAKKSSPIEEAVLKAMKTDPSSVSSQIQLTKETLKQMGLDPGKSADMGCLVQNN